MKKVIFILSFALFTLNCQSKKTEPNKNIEQSIDALVQKYIDLDIFSGVVLLAEKGNPAYHKAFGLANRETKMKNTLNTKFDIGSMNKTFTKIVIYQLLEEGKLSLDDKLGKYLDGFHTEASKKITINHLINHQSGIGDYVSPGYFEAPLESRTINGVVERIKTLPLYFEPGTEQEYSNAGFVVLGAIIEKITSKTYAENVRERIVKPLKLKDTYLENVQAIDNRSIGYWKSASGQLENNEGMLEIPKPDGGFQSTTLDVLTFYNAYHYSEKLMRVSTKKEDEYLVFFESLKEKEGKATAQAGGYNGANTVMYEIPSQQKSIIVFANMDEPVAEQLGAGILKILRGETPPDPQLPARQNVYQAWEKNGIEYVKNHFEELTVNFHATDPKDLILNELGYDLLFEGKIDEAIQFFELNTEIFPEVANNYDSLGEAYLKKGDRDQALSLYKKALELDPELPSAKAMVKELEN